MRHLVNQGGIPAVIFGPGDIAQAHKPDECIDLAEYTACIEHLIAFIAAWCNEEGKTALAGAAIPER
jgi:acetylornithine deacetylase